jgi:hypothetical protein
MQGIPRQHRQLPRPNPLHSSIPHTKASGSRGVRLGGTYVQGWLADLLKALPLTHPTLEPSPHGLSHHMLHVTL